MGLVQYAGLQQAADLGWLRGRPPYSARAWALVLHNLPLSIEAPLLYLLVRASFPPDELSNWHDREEDGGEDEERRAVAVPPPPDLSPYQRGAAGSGAHVALPVGHGGYQGPVPGSHL